MKYEGNVKPRPHETLDEYASRCREQALLVIRHTASLDLADRVVVRIEKGSSGIISGGWTAETPECEGKRHSGLITEE